MLLSAESLLLSEDSIMKALLTLRIHVPSKEREEKNKNLCLKKSNSN